MKTAEPQSSISPPKQSNQEIINDIFLQPAEDVTHVLAFETCDFQIGRQDYLEDVDLLI